MGNKSSCCYCCLRENELNSFSAAAQVLGVAVGILVVPRECLLLTLNPASKGIGGKGKKAGIWAERDLEWLEGCPDADCPSWSCTRSASSGAGCVLNGPDQSLGPKGLRLGSKWVAPETVSLTGHSSSVDYLSLPDVASANGLCLLWLRLVLSRIQSWLISWTREGRQLLPWGLTPANCWVWLGWLCSLFKVLP